LSWHVVEPEVLPQFREHDFDTKEGSAVAFLGTSGLDCSLSFATVTAFSVAKAPLIEKPVNSTAAAQISLTRISASIKLD
jgi:hypothetical protein